MSKIKTWSVDIESERSIKSGRTKASDFVGVSVNDRACSAVGIIRGIKKGRLVAAAPELLKALYVAAKWMEPGDELSFVRTVIAKAEGRE